MITDTATYPRMRWLVFLATGICMMSTNMYLVSLAPLLPKIAQNLGVDVGSATAFMSLFTIAASCSLILGGFLCDRYGVLAVLLLANLLASGASLIMPWVGNSYQGVLWARIIEGIGTGFAFCTMASVIAVWFPPKERGIVTGLLGTFVILGAVVGFPLSSVIYELTKSWQQMSAWLSILGWISFVMMAVLILGPKPQLPSMAAPELPTQGKSAFSRAFSEPTAWVCLVVLFFGAWLLQTIFNITPTYLAADKPLGIGFGHIGSARFMLGASIAGVFAPIVSGIIQDKFFRSSARPFMFIGFALCAVFMFALLIPVVYTNPLLLMICLVLAGSGISILLPAVVVFIASSYDVRIAGKIFGICNGIGSFGGGAGLIVAGATVAARGNYRLAVTIIALAGAAGFLSVLFLRRPRGEERI